MSVSSELANNSHKKASNRIAGFFMGAWLSTAPEQWQWLIHG